MLIGEGIEVLLGGSNGVLDAPVDGCTALPHLLQDCLWDDGVANGRIFQHINLWRRRRKEQRGRGRSKGEEGGGRERKRREEEEEGERSQPGKRGHAEKPSEGDPASRRTWCSTTLVSKSR